MKLTWSFQSKRFATWPNNQDESLISWERKELLRWNKKHYSSYLRGFKPPNIVSDLRVHLKVELSPSKFFIICFNDRPSKTIENAFFHLKGSFRSQDIYIFALTFSSCRKNDLINPGWQIITIHTLPKISWSKDKQTMKIGQLLQYNKIFFFKYHAENEAGRLVSNIFLFF